MEGVASCAGISPQTRWGASFLIRIERAILGLIEDKDVCDERFTAVDLARAIYRKPRPI
jgi:hypothetical protein